MSGASWETYATDLAHMARDLASQSSVQATLDKIVAYAVDLVWIPGSDLGRSGI